MPDQNGDLTTRRVFPDIIVHERGRNLRNHLVVEVKKSSKAIADEHNYATHIKIMSPTALLVIVGENDSLVPINTARAQFGKAAEPKKLIVHPVGHFDFYVAPGLSETAVEAIEWYDRHLRL